MADIRPLCTTPRQNTRNGLRDLLLTDQSRHQGLLGFQYGGGADFFLPNPEPELASRPVGTALVKYCPHYEV